MRPASCSAGGNSAPEPHIAFNISFPGQYYDAETGLHYNRFRYYEPPTGRYLSADPIGWRGGANTYLYAGINPLSFIDFLGLDFKVNWHPTDSVRNEMARQALDEIRNTERGRDLLDELENRGGADTTLDDRDDLTCRTSATGRSIDFDPLAPEDITTEDGTSVPADPARKLGHEVGHAAEPGKPDFDSQGRATPGTNVEDNENAIAKQRGQRRRERR